MTRLRRVESLGIAAVALALAALWLRFAPAIAGTSVGNSTGLLSEAIFTFVIFGPLLVSSVAGAALCRVSGQLLGRSPLSSVAIGAAIGFGGIMLATGYAMLAGTLTAVAYGGASAAILAGLAITAVQVAAEEALFRGWLQPLLARTMAAPAAVGIVAIAFAGLHMVSGAYDPVVLLNLALGGALFGALSSRAGGVSAAFGAHLAWNATEQMGVGLDPNPGVGSFGSIVDWDLVGPARWGGSPDGLNASWAMAIALCAFLVPLILWRVRKPPVITAAEPTKVNPAVRRRT